MSLIASGPAAASPTRPWPADQVEHWPLERLIAYANTFDERAGSQDRDRSGSADG